MTKILSGYSKLHLIAQTALYCNFTFIDKPDKYVD